MGVVPSDAYNSNVLAVGFFTVYTAAATTATELIDQVPPEISICIPSLNV